MPEGSLATFPPEFQQGMAARAAELGDIGENAPERWEKPLGTQDVHLVVVGLASDNASLEAAFRYARDASRDLSGVVPIWQQHVQAAADLRNMFGFADGIGHPAVEGSGIPGTNPYELPLKAGEFVLGYESETHNIAPIPQPDVLGRNGTYAVFRKLHTAHSGLPPIHQSDRQRQRRGGGVVGPQDRRTLAKWRRRLHWLQIRTIRNLVPTQNATTPSCSATTRVASCPTGAHVRLANPRDSLIIGVARLHRMIRRGTNYGQQLPPGVLEDDGADRGLLFAFVGAHLDRQFEFVQREWINDGKFIGTPAEKTRW